MFSPSPKPLLRFVDGDVFYNCSHVLNFVSPKLGAKPTDQGFWDPLESHEANWAYPAKPAKPKPDHSLAP